MTLDEIRVRTMKDNLCINTPKLILIAEKPLVNDTDEILRSAKGIDYLDRCFESKFKSSETCVTYIHERNFNPELTGERYSYFVYGHLVELLMHYISAKNFGYQQTCIGFIGQAAFDAFKVDKENYFNTNTFDVTINEQYKFISISSDNLSNNIYMNYTVLPAINDPINHPKDVLNELTIYDRDTVLKQSDECTLNDFINRLNGIISSSMKNGGELSYFTLDGKCNRIPDKPGTWRIDYIQIDDLKFNKVLTLDPNPYFKDQNQKILLWNKLREAIQTLRVKCKCLDLFHLFGGNDQLNLLTSEMDEAGIWYSVNQRFKCGAKKFEIRDMVTGRTWDIGKHHTNTPASEWYDKWFQENGALAIANASGKNEARSYTPSKQEWIYDIEIFDKDWLIVAKTLDKRYRLICWNDGSKLSDWILDKIVIGFNNAAYDNAVIKRCMAVENQMKALGVAVRERKVSVSEALDFAAKTPTIKESSDILISGEKIPQLDDIAPIAGFRVPHFLSWDISFHMPFDVRRNSLKKLTMSVLNRRNYDSSVSFDTVGELTVQQREDVEKYCEMDVDNTLDLFMPDPNNPKRTFAKESYDIRWNMINEYHMNCKTLINKAASFAGKLLCGEDAQAHKGNTLKKFDIVDGKKVYNDKGSDFEYYSIPELAEKELAGTEVLKFYHDHQKNPNYITEKIEVYLDGIEDESHKCQFGFGGLHQALVNYGGKNLVNMDVASLYPSLLVHYNLMSRGASKRPDSYKEVYFKRLDAKAKSKTDPKYKLLNEGLKLILNGSIGAFLSNFNPLYDTWSNSSICVHGQLLIYILVLRLKKAGFKIVQINTDGICVEKRNDVDYMPICNQWVEDTKLVLEYDDIKILQQNNVNNYYCEFDGGKIKSKGFYLSNEKFGKATSKILCNIVTQKPLLEGCEPRDFVMYKKHAISEIFDGETRTKVDGRSLAFVVGWENDPRTKSYYSRSKKARATIKKDEAGKDIVDQTTGEKVTEMVNTESKITGFKDNSMLLVDDLNDLKMEEIDTSAYIAFAKNLLDIPDDFGPYYNEHYQKIQEPDVYQALNAFKDNTIANPTNQNCYCQNFLYECDDLSKEEQEEMINRVKDKLYRVVWSGNKSYHIVVRIPKPVTSTLYKVLWFAIRNELHLIGADEQSGLPSKYTRTPGHNNPKTGAEQTLYAYDKNIFDPTQLLEDLPKLKSEAKPVKEFTGKLTIAALQKHIDKLDWTDGNRFASTQRLSPVLISQVDDEELYKMIPCELEKDHKSVIAAKRRYFERNKDLLLSDKQKESSNGNLPL